MDPEGETSGGDDELADEDDGDASGDEDGSDAEDDGDSGTESDISDWGDDGDTGGRGRKRAAPPGGGGGGGGRGKKRKIKVPDYVRKAARELPQLLTKKERNEKRQELRDELNALG